jgi:hypothetical protein
VVFFRHLLAVVVELLLLDGLLPFFRMRGVAGARSVAVALVAALAVAPGGLGGRLRASAAVGTAAALVALRAARFFRAARLARRAVAAALLRLGLGVAVARARLEARDDSLLDLLAGSMSRSRVRSSPDTSDTAWPVSPARPVRPMRWT